MSGEPRRVSGRTSLDSRGGRAWQLPVAGRTGRRWMWRRRRTTVRDNVRIAGSDQRVVAPGICRISPAGRLAARQEGERGMRIRVMEPRRDAPGGVSDEVVTGNTACRGWGRQACSLPGNGTGDKVR